MSFKCDQCQQKQPSHAKPVVRVVETRERKYEPRFNGKIQVDAGGVGTEIVREEKICRTCAGYVDEKQLTEEIARVEKAA